MQNTTKDFLSHLPAPVSRELSRAIQALPAEKMLTGVTLRRGRVSSLSYGGRHIPLPFVLTAEELDSCFRALCGGALYPHEDSLLEGYLTLPSGIRVGVSGRAARSGAAVTGIYSVDTLVLRLFSDVRDAGKEAEAVFRRLPRPAGLLVYSPPAVGKTTLLCDLVRRLSSGESPLSVVIVDERYELSGRFHEKNLLLSFLSGFPKEKGLEIATRTLSPDVIACDEIGSEREAAAILSLANAGVSLVATAHAASLAGLLARPPLMRLWQAGVFGAAIGISRDGECRLYHTSYREDTR